MLARPETLNTLEGGQCDVDRRTGAVDVQGTTIDAGLGSFATVTADDLDFLGCILTDKTLATERISIPVKEATPGFPWSVRWHPSSRG